MGHSWATLFLDKAKTDLIVNFAPPTCVKDVRSFLRHADFYHCFIKDFSKVTKALTNLLAKDVSFHFFKECYETFTKPKEALTIAPVLHSPIWEIFSTNV